MGAQWNLNVFLSQLLKTTKHGKDCVCWWDSTEKHAQGQVSPKSNGHWGAIGWSQACLCLLFGCGQLLGVGGWAGRQEGIGWKQENPLLLNPMPLLHSVKQCEALFILRLGPVSLLKMKTKFSFKRRELG